MDPDSYSHTALQRDLRVLQQRDAPRTSLEDSLYRLQRVHPGPQRAAFVRALVRLVEEGALSPMVRRNAAFAVAKLGSADPGHGTVLKEALNDPDPSVRAACRWALGQLAYATPEAAEARTSSDTPRL
jgi:HEAT repeat protein